MNRKELVRRTATVMRENNIRKPISSRKQVLHISDDEGNSKDFVVKKTDKGVIFTNDDIENVVDALLAVIMDSIKKGESVSIRGFGTLMLNYRKARTGKHPVTGEETEIPGHYTTKFESGTDLKRSAKLYELSLADKLSGFTAHTDTDEDDIFDAYDDIVDGEQELEDGEYNGY